MRHIWFWTFWHWSRESFHAGALLRGPLLGIGSHWDEWFRHEASAADRETIRKISEDPHTQRELVTWLAEQWAPEAEWRGAHPPASFVLGQLAHVPPFDRWHGFDAFRASYGAPGIAAIVLAEGSAGESTDVCTVEAIAIPVEGESMARAIAPEGFNAEPSDLDIVHRAARSQFAGKGLGVLLGLWLVGGRRPYPRWLAVALGIGWLGVAALILVLRFGADPGDRLPALAGTLLGLWGLLAIVGIGVAAGVGLQAWRDGRALRRLLERSEVRVRMEGGLTLKGGSAGLPFCLNAMLAIYRARPDAALRSWLWRRVLRPLHTDMASWAATGVVTERARLRPVVLEPKLRACLARPDVRHILTPRQREARPHVIARLRATLPAVPRLDVSDALRPEMRFGYAAEPSTLAVHQARHVAGSLMAIGSLSSGWQVAVNALAVAASLVVLLGASELRNLVLPPPAPNVVRPASPSPYYLWVSLDTRYPNDFLVNFESEFWANRIARVKEYGGANASMRAEMRLRRLSRNSAGGGDDGLVWIVRRRSFLGREFTPGERVGRYTFSYVARLDHE